MLSFSRALTADNVTELETLHTAVCACVHTKCVSAVVRASALQDEEKEDTVMLLLKRVIQADERLQRMFRHLGLFVPFFSPQVGFSIKIRRLL